MPATSSRKTGRPASSPPELLISRGLRLLFLFCMTATRLGAHEYFEGFDKPGKPVARDGFVWDFTADLSPVSGWKDLIPGDGFAYLAVERDALRKLPKGSAYWPFQTLSVGPVTSNHRISIRAKNTAIPGVACLLFTYREKTKVDEIDIEIVADDTESNDTGHRTEPGGGWTDVRLNTWANADSKSLLPTRTVRMPILDSAGNKVSHRDGRFHIYTIEWKPEAVRFYIDGVLQKVIDDIVPDYPSTVIFGMRQMPWAGRPGWSGSQTMLVDWLSIEPVSDY